MGRLTLLEDYVAELCRCPDRRCAEVVRVRYAERAGEAVAEPDDVDALRAASARARKCLAKLD